MRSLDAPPRPTSSWLASQSVRSVSVGESGVRQRKHTDWDENLTDFLWKNFENRDPCKGFWSRRSVYCFVGLSCDHFPERITSATDFRTSEDGKFFSELWPLLKCTVSNLNIPIPTDSHMLCDGTQQPVSAKRLVKRTSFKFQN